LSFGWRLEDIAAAGPSATGGETYRWLLADDRARRIWPAAEPWMKDFG
jgi:hypothetical protein